MAMQPERAAITNDEVISTLNNLIETCRDGQTGFQEAMEGVQNSSLKGLFAEFSQQRAQFVGELQQEVRSLGGEPENTGSVAGALHRGWIDLKAAITGKDESAILAECERGEASAVTQYQDALGTNLPASVRDIVARQAVAVNEAYQRIKSNITINTSA